MSYQFHDCEYFKTYICLFGPAFSSSTGVFIVLKDLPSLGQEGGTATLPLPYSTPSPTLQTPASSSPVAGVVLTSVIHGFATSTKYSGIM